MPSRPAAEGLPRDAAQLRLGPATRVLWRDSRAVQFELGDRSVVVTGLAHSALAAVTDRRSHVARVPLDVDSALALADLGSAGYLWPRLPAPDDPAQRPCDAPPLPRLGGELAALAGRHGDRAATVLAGRAARTVELHGNAAITAHLAAVLAAAGVGRVRCVGSGSALLRHAVPGGVSPTDEGDDLATAMAAAVSRAAPEDGPAGDPDAAADLLVLAGAGPVSDDRRGALHAGRVAHLVVDVTADRGVVGPLVLPGLTSCLRCADLHRRDRDPAWPVLAVQLAVGAARAPATGAALGTTVAGVAAAQILGYLDGEDCAVVEGSLEICPPDWRVRRRSRIAHPECDCLAGTPTPGSSTVGLIAT